MTMPVTDEQEATLHAQLARKFDEYGRLLDSMDGQQGMIRLCLAFAR
jgi:hypothetical protein